MLGAIWEEKFGFKPFGYEHGALVMLWLGLTLWLVAIGRRSPLATQRRIGQAIGWIIFGFEAIWLLHKTLNGTFLIRENLPLDLCNVCALAIPLVMHSPTSPYFQTAYYWILTGTLQGVITPDLDWIFPYIGYLKYWFVHAGLVTAVVYATAVYGQRPSPRGLLVAFLGLQIWAGLVYVCNLLLDANYGFLMRKPAHASLFDYFGTHYILVTQAACLFLFTVFGSPFWYHKKKKG